ncbi:hypothetical protein P7C70_g3963, partial [Phenoliferia sp. Uapishka_3]
MSPDIDAAALAAKYPLADPELRPFLAAFPGFDTTPPIATGVRAWFASFPPPPLPDPSVVSVESREITGPAGGKLRLLVFRPFTDSKVPVILGIHGGGFLLGAPEIETDLHSHFAANGMVVVSPAYRLAPEHPYPAAYDDVEAAYNYITSAAGQESLNIDGTRVGVYGASAGSALATGLAIRLNQQGCGDGIKLVVMDSTLADDRLIYPSQAENLPTAIYHIWTRENSLAMRALTFTTPIEEPLPLEASPLRSTRTSDFSGLCPHIVTSCELDSLAEQGQEYFKRLQSAGVDVQYKFWERSIHGFSQLCPKSQIGREAVDLYTKAFKRRLFD